MFNSPTAFFVGNLNMKDKKFEKIDPDGYHYWRKIGGELKRKVMIGIYDENLLHDIDGK